MKSRLLCCTCCGICFRRSYVFSSARRVMTSVRHTFIPQNSSTRYKDLDDFPDPILIDDSRATPLSQKAPSYTFDEGNLKFHYIDEDDSTQGATSLPKPKGERLIQELPSSKRKRQTKTSQLKISLKKSSSRLFSLLPRKVFGSRASTKSKTQESSLDLKILQKTKALDSESTKRNTVPTLATQSSRNSGLDLRILDRSPQPTQHMLLSEDSRTTADFFFSLEHVKATSLRKANPSDLIEEAQDIL